MNRIAVLLLLFFSPFLLTISAQDSEAIIKQSSLQKRNFLIKVGADLDRLSRTNKPGLFNHMIRLDVEYIVIEKIGGLEASLGIGFGVGYHHGNHTQSYFDINSQNSYDYVFNRTVLAPRILLHTSPLKRGLDFYIGLEVFSLKQMIQINEGQELPNNPLVSNLSNWKHNVEPIIGLNYFPLKRFGAYIEYGGFFQEQISGWRTGLSFKF